MKKTLAVAMLLLLTGFSLFANPSYNPQDSFYNYVESWQSRGIIGNVPPLRPYPVSNIKDILETVIEKGNEHDKEIATSIYEEVTGRAWHLYNTTDERLKRGKASTDEASSFNHMTEDNIGAEGSFSFLDDIVSFGYDVGFMARTEGDDSRYLGYGQQTLSDTAQDPANIGKFSVNVDANTLLNVGLKNVYLQAGVNRTGYGYFLNNGLALSESNYHKPTFALTYFGNKFSYSQTMSVLAASDNVGNGSTYGKFLNFHSIDYTPNTKISFSAYEAVVYGQRFEPSYLIPTPYMVCQAFSGYGDSGVNLLMGVGAKAYPVSGLKVASTVFVDDVNVNKVIKLDLDTRMYLAWDSGLSYYFSNKYVTNVDADYMIITPYMYGHREGNTTYNYQNYTNLGKPMGAANYPPNSGILNLSLALTPVKNLNVTLSGMFMMHGNVCESYSAKDALKYLASSNESFTSDGSLYTTIATPSGWVSDYNDHLYYLTQEHEMLVLQTGIKTDYTIKTSKYGDFIFNAAYLFELINNKGVDSNIYKAGTITNLVQSGDNIAFVYNGENYWSYEDLEKVVNIIKQEWADSLYNVMNHYFTVGFTYKF